MEKTRTIKGIEYNIAVESRMSNSEIELLLGGGLLVMDSWSEGEGRWQCFYEILKGENVFVLCSEYYGFEEFMQPIYNFIKLNKTTEGSL